MEIRLSHAYKWVMNCMDDDKIIEMGGTQEDINKYAHDVGGACGAIYGGTCDFCGKKDDSYPSPNT